MIFDLAPNFFVAYWLDEATVRATVVLFTGLLLIASVVARLRPGPGISLAEDAIRQLLAATIVFAGFYIIQVEATIWDAQSWWLPLAGVAVVMAFVGPLATYSPPDPLARLGMAARSLGIGALLVSARCYADTRLATSPDSDAMAHLEDAFVFAAVGTLLVAASFGVALWRLASAARGVWTELRSQPTQR